MPAKKLLMQDKSTEPPVKKQWTGSPSSDRGSETNHDRADKSKKKKRKKKEPKSEPTMAHMGYLESRILEPGAGFFIKSFKTWWLELEKQSQGIRHSAMSVRHKLQMLEQMYGVKLSTLNNVRTKYLVEVFKYPGPETAFPRMLRMGMGVHR